MSRQVTCFCEQSLTKKIVQKLYKIYTKIKQNTYFVYVLYTKIVQIKILFDNECTKNVYQIPVYIYIQKLYKLYKTCTKFGLKADWNLMNVFCSFKQSTNYAKPIQLANWNGLCMFFVHTCNVKTIQIVYKCKSNHIYMRLLMHVFLYIQRP